jgi:hypothetical protein
METLLWILLPGCVALGSGLLAWFIMQSRMDVKLAEQRERLAEERGALEAERQSMKTSLENALRAADESARRESLDTFLGEITVERRHYTRENRLLMHNRKTLVLQERIYFRNIPLSDWIEHEVVMDEATDVERLVQDMTIFDREVVSITEAPRTRRQLA